MTRIVYVYPDNAPYRDRLIILALSALERKYVGTHPRRARVKNLGISAYFQDPAPRRFTLVVDAGRGLRYRRSVSGDLMQRPLVELTLVKQFLAFLVEVRTGGVEIHTERTRGGLSSLFSQGDVERVIIRASSGASLVNYLNQARIFSPPRDPETLYRIR